MEMNAQEKYYYGLAEQSVLSAIKKADLTNIQASWVFCQWLHESGGFASDLADDNYNLGGLCQEEENDTPQPDGEQYYIKFNSLEEYAEYFGRYICLYIEDGIADVTTLAEYITALKNGGYFGDDLEAYIADCEEIHNQYFG